MLSSLISTGVKLANMVRPKVVFVLGAPGSGKGTQCQKIVEHYDYVHLSAGDLLRQERVRPGSEYGQLIETYIREGRIVPVEITCNLLRIAMDRTASDRFLIDGFPRNQNNLDGWNRTLADEVHVLFVLILDCPEEACVQRCLARGADGSGRSDDNAASLTLRFNTFWNETQPIIDYYEQHNLVRRVDATRNPEQVFEDIKIIFDSFRAAGDF